MFNKTNDNTDPVLAAEIVLNIINNIAKLFPPNRLAISNSNSLFFKYFIKSVYPWDIK